MEKMLFKGTNLRQGFVCSRAAPSQWSIDSQPSTQGFVKVIKKEKKKKECKHKNLQQILSKLNPATYKKDCTPWPGVIYPSNAIGSIYEN